MTKPKPKMIPPPEQIKREIKARPMPKGMNKKTLADIEQDKKKRREATINAIRNEYEGNDRFYGDQIERFQFSIGQAF